MKELKRNPVNSEKSEYVGRYEKAPESEYVGKHEKQSVPPLRPLKPLKRAGSPAADRQETAEDTNKIVQEKKTAAPSSAARPMRKKPSAENVQAVSEQKAPAPKRPPMTKKQRAAAAKAKAREQAKIRRQKRRERRRKRITNAVAWVNVAAVGGLLAFGAVYMFAFEHETIAKDENRYLAKFPEFSSDSYFKGEYTEGIADYYNDTVPNRDFFKQIITNDLMPLKGRKFGNDGVELIGMAVEKKPVETTTTVMTTTGTGTTVETSSTATTTTLPKAVDPAVDGEMANNILIANNRGIMIYGGAWGAEKEYAEYVNSYKEQLPDVNVYSLVAPTACSFYTPENYKDLFESEKKDLDSIKRSLKKVTHVDAYTPLLAHKNEDIYSRTDHHWQPLGAYYAAEAFAKEADVDFASLDSYKTITLPNYVGTLYGYSQSADLLNNPEHFVFYKPKDLTPFKITQYNSYFGEPTDAELFLDAKNLDNSSYYLVFGMDDRIVHVHNNKCKNKRTLVIFKDSYGNALLPFLAGSFEDIYMCDIRYFNINAVNFAEEVKCTDMLFAMCTYSAVGPNKDYIYWNINQ